MRALNAFRYGLLIQSLLFILTSAEAAEHSIEFGDYKVHYAVVNSLLIPESVARSHQIVRSEDRMVINISVKKANAPVEARVSGRVTNLINQTVALKFHELKESTAIYYLASLLVNEKDRLEFLIKIQTEGKTDAFLVEFSRRYQ